MITNLLLAQALNASIVAGGISTVSATDSYSISPTASIHTEALVAESDLAPAFHVKLDLSSLPEEEFNLSDATTFKSLEFEVGLAQKIPGIYPKFYAGFGLATRLPGDDSPRVKTPTYFTAGIRFSTNDGSSFIYLGAGPDERLDLNGLYQANVHIVGQLKLAKYSDAKLSLKGDAILSGKTSLVRIGIVVGI